MPALPSLDALVIGRAAPSTVTEKASVSACGIGAGKSWSSLKSKSTSNPLATTCTAVISGGVLSCVLFVTD